MELTEIPDGWSEVSTEYGHETNAYQRTRDGLVLAIERGIHEPAEYAVVALPENRREDTVPVRHIGDRGYLGYAEEESAAKKIAHDWMEQNKR